MTSLEQNLKEVCWYSLKWTGSKFAEHTIVIDCIMEDYKKKHDLEDQNWLIKVEWLKINEIYFW